MDPHYLWILCILYIGEVTPSPTLVLAVVGSPTLLPCPRHPPQPSARSPRPGFRALALLWERAREQGTATQQAWSPLLAVGSDGVVKRGLDGGSWRAAVTGERIEAGDYSLRLREVVASDAGTYRCRLRHAHTRLLEEVQLVVINVRPEGERETPVEGERVCLRCQATRPIPGLRLSWTRRGSYSEDGGRGGDTEEEAGGGGARICLEAVRREDAGEWGCRAQYKRRSVLATISLRVYGFALPEHAVPTVYALPGSPARLWLPVEPGFALSPGGTSGWLRGEPPGAWPPGDAGRANSRLGQDGLSLTLSPALVSDRGLYTGYINISGLLVQRNVRLEIMEVTTSQKGPLPLGSSVTLNVSTSYPEGLDWVDWGHQNASEEHRLDPYSLYLPHVTWGDAGNWSCTLYRNQTVVGHAIVFLEVTDMAPLGSDDPTSSPGRATLVVLFTLLVLIVVLSVLAIARKVKGQRRNFPALDVNLDTSDAPNKKV